MIFYQMKMNRGQWKMGVMLFVSVLRDYPPTKGVSFKKLISVSG